MCACTHIYLCMLGRCCWCWKVVDELLGDSADPSRLKRLKPTSRFFTSLPPFLPFCLSLSYCNLQTLPHLLSALAPLKGTFYSAVYLEMLALQNLAWLKRPPVREGDRPPAWRRFGEAQTLVEPVKGSQLR